MPNHNQTTDKSVDKKTKQHHPQPPASKATLESSPAAEFSEFSAMVADQSDVQAQSAVLRDARIPLLQRQMMAGQMGDMHGNLYIQRVIVSTKQAGKSVSPLFAETTVQRQEEGDHSFDTRHNVPLVPQLTNMSCWAAGAAMLVAWRHNVTVDQEEIAHRVGYWAQYQHAGLDAEDTAMFAAWGLTPEPIQSYTASAFADLLEQYGPLWVAAKTAPGVHVVVVTGISGDGTADGTTLFINDPWPVGAGSQYWVTYRDFELAQGNLARAEMQTEAKPYYIAHN